MVKQKRKGYMVERKIRIILEKSGWRVIRAGGSLGEADLICIKSGKCIFLQIKSTKKQTLYYYGYNKSELEGIPFYLVVDFGYGNIRVTKPSARVKSNEGGELKEFINRI